MVRILLFPFIWCMARAAFVSRRRDEMKDYSNYVVYRFYDKFDTLQLPTTDHDVWSVNEQFTDVKLPKNVKLDAHWNYTVLIKDLNNAIRETYPMESMGDESSIFSLSDLDESFFNGYKDLKTIYLWFDYLHSTFPDLVSVQSIGRTHEGNDLKILKISNNPKENKKTIVVTGGIHAREWITVSTACYVMQQLLHNYKDHVRNVERHFLEKFNYVFIPVINPDGYSYTWETDRLWRKNRQDTYISSCKGIDIETSFNYKWSNNKVNSFPCDENYNGEHAFHAIESQLINSFLFENSPVKYHGFLDFHSYSQEILYPYTFSCDTTPNNYENLVEVSFGISKSIKQTSGKVYDVIAACKDAGSDLTPGMGAGSILDYMYHNEVQWSLQLKLRDTGNHGFLLPSKFIKPVGNEMYNAFRYYCEFLVDPELTVN
ncbi:hypothetical protein KAFR_0F00560 [Kazachstania africana CBS 2517]|uniref:Inactive metallocarboxypeptidase ECM14 n=1 Tax=Kazachstania africana (strain ATCC 22294 / BCRC 22015 / CBS 2517 / CECT 1963 / NBRC 1671 / NRRL Y-8276) TaxID=1071382 RepID=H2AWA3_KAZAF|nr:hypothetical protein KAFR_0F00560 [Kazachstania africana CBS 2517]CCF58653.1 hypothetical protein KAFR_0F00560 [Kazachstania africana CBS 2517]